MQDRFSDEDRRARHLLCLVPSIIVNKALQLDDEVEGMLFCKKDIPFIKSLGMVIACTLPITSAEAERSFSLMK